MVWLTSDFQDDWGSQIDCLSRLPAAAAPLDLRRGAQATDRARSAKRSCVSVNDEQRCSKKAITMGTAPAMGRTAMPLA